jgi:hypothetical protein
MRIHLGGLYATVFTIALVLGACARHHGDEAESSPSSAADGGSDAAAPQIDEAAHVGAKASVTVDALAGGAIDGEGTFTETATGVDLALHVLGCENVNFAKQLPIVIMQGGDCSAATLLGAHWDSPRGEGIPATGCVGNGGHLSYTRANSDAKPWTVGTPDASNVIGHAFVVYDPETLQPGGCGVIGRAPDKVQAPATTSMDAGSGPSELARAAIAGLCLGRMFVRDNTQECPNPKELNACAATHCELDACLETCAEYTACLDQQVNAGTDICEATTVQCQITQACSECSASINQCVLGFCADQVSCAAPVTPGGPCEQLEACCNMQGDDDARSCIELVHTLEKLSGDPSCYGAERDLVVTAHLKVPCMFQ